jgi:TolB-like protein/cytochrome c-type biogenesis protein CcmH/NrfG
MPEPTRAVFLSYASQDAEAARRICEALRAAGLEVWFDQNELRGGDAWDQKIRRQIHDCALFVPIISANTDSRTEGYFRLEWKLAVDRSHLMADDAAFLFPVVIDETPEPSARVPDKFRTVQWTRLPGGTCPAAFAQHVAALLSGREKPVRLHESPPPARRAGFRILATALALVALAAAGLLAWRAANKAPVAAPANTGAARAAPTPPAHSIAVLPFADLSASRDQEYFSDGLAEELLSLLSKVPGLQVAARTSAFSFKGHTADIPTIGRQLVVANVLEGSVRKVGKRLRITAQLVRADNGYEVWSEVYDRELGDVFRIQDEIAASVVHALQVKLLGGAVLRSTSAQNPDAYLVLLQGRARMASQRLADIKAAAGNFEQAIRLDPNYGPAYVELATAKVQLAEFDMTENLRAEFGAAVAEAGVLLERALALDPRNAQAYVERGYLRADTDLKGAEQDYRKAIELDPNSARAYEGLAAIVFQDPRRRDEVPRLLEKARVLDPLDPKYEVLKAKFLMYGRSDLVGAGAVLSSVVARYPVYVPALTLLAEVHRVTGRSAEAVMYDEQALKLDPLYRWARLALVNSYADVGDFDAARQVAAEAPHQLPVDRIRLMIHDGDWHAAAEAAYDALDKGTMPLLNEPWLLLALRTDAHATGQFQRLRAVLERQTGVTWSAQGVPTLPTELGVASSTLGLADSLIASGERDKGTRLLRACIADMNYVVHDLRRGEFWYVGDEAIAQALLGDRKATLAALKRAANVSYTIGGLMDDPAFKPISNDPEFQLLQRRFREQMATERAKLDRLRAEGRVPPRR